VTLLKYWLKGYYKLLILLTAAFAMGVVATVLLTAERPVGEVTAQQEPVDEVPAQIMQAETTINCARQRSSVVLTERFSQATNSTVFTDLPGASTSVLVPANQSNCILVTFSADAACLGLGPQNTCQVRVILNPGPMLMHPTSPVNFVVEALVSDSRSYQWITRVSGGALGTTYTATVQWQTSSGRLPVTTLASW